MGDLSPHFSAIEFRCHGFGRPGHTPHPDLVSTRLVAFLELARGLAGDRPLKIVSGHRCRWWNRHQGGATESRHIPGEAADVPPGALTIAQARQAGFTGIGYNRRRQVVHVDVRPGHRVEFLDE